MDPRHRQSLGVARLMMVLSSVSPLFALWAIRGTTLISDRHFVGACLLFILVPNFVLWLRIRAAVRNRETRELVVGHAEDHRDHLLVYLFAMLLPFYADHIATWRALAAVLTALAFIVFLFWHLNLHYMNMIFAAFGLRVFTLHPNAAANLGAMRIPIVLITERAALAPGDRLTAFRLSDTVYFEARE